MAIAVAAPLFTSSLYAAETSGGKDSERSENVLTAAKAETTVRVKVTDTAGGAPMEFAAVTFNDGKGHIVGGMTDASGQAAIVLPAGKGKEWKLTVSSVGYTSVERQLTLPVEKEIDMALAPSAAALKEVVVTASEGRGMTSSSLIGRDAMTHLQPSSFSDLLELLPGAVSQDPQMGTANMANLRQAQNVSPTDNYATGSLGTSFVVDGVATNTTADMQATGDNTRATRLSTGKGVDMRSMSTDDIESVEVVRGIASAEYGELTSGLFNIKRKSGRSPLHLRFKADMLSQLFFVGKGFQAAPGWTINTSLDYLDSKIDPRNNRDNFKRVTASLRSSLRKDVRPGLLIWNTSINYGGTFEKDNDDPDLTVNNTIDNFSTRRHNVSWANTLTLQPKWRNVDNITLTTSVSYSSDRLEQERTVAASRLYNMPISTTPGSNRVGWLPMRYDANLLVDGKPFTAMAKLATRIRHSLLGASNALKLGVEWDMSKNYGRGQVYDLERPIVAGNISRPRAFSDIPAIHQLSAYAENNMNFRAGGSAVELQLGLRETQLLHLPGDYHLANRPHIDPRGNLKWQFPAIWVKNNPLQLTLAGGAGLMTKMPVAAMLYPDPVYVDYPQLNYFHNVEAYRNMTVYTYVEDPVNTDLKAARNFKWEVRGDVEYRDNRLSVTYFREDMKNAFRRAPMLLFHSYRLYDASGFDPVAAGGAPTIDVLPWRMDDRIYLLSAPSNSSQIKKEGVEFTFASRRFPVIRTRVTVAGAWLRTTLCNSEDLWYKPGAVVNNRELQLAGLYADRDGTTYESFNTNFTFDTDVPRLGLNFSVAVQNMWFTSTQSLYREGVPYAYVGTDGVVKPFPADAASDPYLKQLIRTFGSSAFDRQKVPVSTTFNIKATKSLWANRLQIALFVNRLLSITPDYERYGMIQRRYTSPYFGMELNLNI